MGIPPQLRLNCNLHSKVGRNYSSSHFNEWNSSNELAYVAVRQFPVSEEAKFCAQGFKSKIFSVFCRNTLKCSFLKMLPLFPTRHWGVLPRGAPGFLLQYGNFVQPLNFFPSRGKTSEAICGHVNRNKQLPWGKGAGVGRARRRRGSSHAGAAEAHHEQRGLPPRPEMPPCFSLGSLVPLQGSDALCRKHPTMLYIPLAVSPIRNQAAQHLGSMGCCELLHTARTHSWSPPSYPAAASSSVPCRIILGHLVGFQSHN